MVKRYFALVLSLIFCFTMVSCSDPGDISPGPTETAQPAVNTPEANATEHTHDDPDIATERPVYTGEPLIKLEPEARVYIGLANQDCDLYPETYFGSLHFYIITLDHYAARDIQVEIPMQTKHSIRIDDITDVYRKWEENGLYQGFSYYDYMCMRGADWKTIYDLKLSTEEKLKEIDSAEIEDYQKKSEMWDDAKKPYTDALYTYYDDYEQLSGNDLPEFHVYNVNVSIDGFDDPKLGLYEETADHAKIIIGESIYEVEFGEWRIHKSLPAALKTKTYGIRQKMIAVTTIIDSPYSGGFVRLQDALSFVSSKDLTITGMRYFGNDLEVLGAHVNIKSEDGADGTAQDFYWDMNMPLDVSAGQIFDADIFIHDDRFKEYEVNMTLFIVMDYETDGRECSMLIPCTLERLNNCSETYLLSLGGVDIGEYKYYFYVPSFEGYLFDMPQSWSR